MRLNPKKPNHMTNVIKMSATPDPSMPAKEYTEFTLFEDYENVRAGVVKKRRLRFDLNALADFEQETGMGFGQLMQKQALFATARALLWSGLKHEDRALTIPSVGVLMGKAMKDGKANVNDFLTVAMAAAAEQGALGPVDQVMKNVEPSEGAPHSATDPNEHSTTSVLDLIEASATESRSPGPDGSSEPSPSDTAH